MTKSANLIQHYRESWSQVFAWGFILEWWKESWLLHAFSGLILGMVVEIGKNGLPAGIIAYVVCCLAAFAGWTGFMVLFGPLPARWANDNRIACYYACDDSDREFSSFSSNYCPQINPATGYFMTEGGIDIGGNP